MSAAEETLLDDFIKVKLGTDALTKLEHQSRGGNNNSKGNNHEQYFAVYKLAKHYSEALSDDVEISSQDRAFVDDLVVLNKSKNSKKSYQLKDSAAVYWHKKKGICPYFQRQYIVDTEHYQITDSETILVLAQSNVYELRKQDIPTSISAHTKCLHFANSNSVNEMLLENPDFKNAISKLCVLPDEIDKLEVIVQILMGAWSTHNKTERSVHKLIELATSTAKPDFFKSETSSLALDSNVIRILDSIDNLRYEVIDNCLKYNYGDFEGLVRCKLGTTQFQAICDEIVSQQPTEALKLCLILMGTGDGA